MDFLRWLEHMRCGAGTVFFQLCTFLGQDIVVLIVICLLFWCLNKKLAYQIGLSFFISGLLSQNLKITCRIERPWILDPTLTPAPSAISAATGYSFPSGHTQTAVSLFANLACATKRHSLRLLCVSLFLLVGFSRMYLGVHTPKDVLAAILLAGAVTLLVRKCFFRIPDIFISIFLTLASVLTIFYAFRLMQAGIIPARHGVDCCKTAGAGLGFAAGWYIERTFIRFSETNDTKERALRFSLGAATTLLLKIFLKLLLGSSIPSEIVQYFLLVLFITCIYPCSFRKISALSTKL